MINKISKIFWPQLLIPKNAKLNPTSAMSKSQKLMTELGLLKPLGNGLFQITPLAQRSLDKCVDHVHSHMKRISGQKVTLPILTPTFLWKKSGRLKQGVEEIFFISNQDDQNKNQFLLSPTHEESITYLLAQSFPISYKQLPLRLYQIGPKFRDELKPRFGLMRAKEFLMKDLYSFDKTLAEAEQTYAHVNKQYEIFLESFELPWLKIEADNGTIGGSLSHEYHVQSDVGEDLIVKCLDCESTMNFELCNESSCFKCNSKNLKQSRGIEIAHTFLLGQKYSQSLEAKFLNSKGISEHFVMGCYGIGISRLIASSLEVLSSETELKWPILLAPFDICVIPPKDGSLEAEVTENFLHEMLQQLQKICGEDEIVLDDRTNLTIGKRLMDSKRMGYSLIIVAGSKVKEIEPKFEIHSYEKSEIVNLQELYKQVDEFRNRKDKLKYL